MNPTLRPRILIGTLTTILAVVSTTPSVATAVEVKRTPDVVTLKFNPYTLGDFVFPGNAVNPDAMDAFVVLGSARRCIFSTSPEPIDGEATVYVGLELYGGYVFEESSASGSYNHSSSPIKVEVLNESQIVDAIPLVVDPDRAAVDVKRSTGNQFHVKLREWQFVELPAFTSRQGNFSVAICNEGDNSGMLLKSIEVKVLPAR